MTKLSVKEIEELFESNLPEWKRAAKEREARAAKEQSEKEERMRKSMRQRQAAARERRAAKPKQLLADVPFSGVAVIKGISRTRAPRQPLEPGTVVVMMKGKTKIQPGSLRDRVLKALEQHDGPMSIADLIAKSTVKMEPLKGVIGKLREAGWVEVQ